MSAQQSSMDAVNGLYAEFNLSDGLMRQIALKCPAILSGGRKGDKRGIRYNTENDTTQYTSCSVLQNIHKEVADQLQQHGITARTLMSHAEWVLAPTTNGRTSTGPTHRDTVSEQPGYLTVLLFFGDRKMQEGRGYGGVKVWRNSQSFCPGHDLLRGAEFNNVKRELQKLDGERGKNANLKEFNCVVFDSRLIHESLQHTQHTPWASLTFCLRFEGMAALPRAHVYHYAKPEECETINMQQYL